jgi:hypothetical protein
MTAHVQRSHTPEQQRLFSNIGHLVVGAIITTGGALLLRDAVSAADSYGEVPSRVLTGAGALLVLGLVAGSFHHGGRVDFFKADPQEREHLEMAAILTAGRLASRFGRLGKLVSGAGIARIGQMFLAHERHGTSEAEKMARAKHQRLGKAILAAATTHTLGDLLEIRWIRAIGSALLIASGLPLLAYREPEGAFATAYGTGGHLAEEAEEE